MHPGKQSEEQKRRRERRFAEAGAKRESRFSSYYEEEKAAEYPQEAFMLRAAGENSGNYMNSLSGTVRRTEGVCCILFRRRITRI